MLKVAVIGPESTGKTTLTLWLAKYFKAPYELEYAREYVEVLNRTYCYDDVVAIAKQQIAQEQRYEQVSGEGYLFFDTDLIITKLWFEFCYKQVPDFVDERLKAGFFDFYLLCAPDLPWVADPVREQEENRDLLFEGYRREIEKIGKPYAIVRGRGDERNLNALNALQTFEL